MSDDFIDGGDPFDPEDVAAWEAKGYDEKVAQTEAIAAHIRRAKEAYTRLFSQGDATADDVAFVMQDLAWFCNAYDPMWNADSRVQERNVARRDVYQRIVEYSKLETETLMKRYMQNQNT